MKFTTHKLIRFHHCDPAGIVFYPQYYYLLHEAQEDFLAHIGFPEHEMIAGGLGVPIVDMKTEFLGMCRYGDEVNIELSLTRLGHTSIGMHYEIHSASRNKDGGQSLKLRADSVVVCAEIPNGKALRIPDGWRDAMLPYLQTPREDKS